VGTLDLQRLSGMLGFAARARKLVFGTELALRAVQSGAAKLVLVSLYASEGTKKKLRTKCEFYSTPRVEADIDTELLGKLVGKASAISAVAVTDGRFAEEISRAAGKED